MPNVTRAEYARMTQGTALPVKKRKPIGEGEIMRRKQWEAEMCRLPGIFIPVQTVNELNAHTHWRVRQKRAAAQRPRAKRAVQSYRIAHPIELPVSVRFTRYSPGTLDPADGLPSAFKHIIDGMADAFGVDDKSPLYHWLPPIQVKAKYYAVRIELTSL